MSKIEKGKDYFIDWGGELIEIDDEIEKFSSQYIEEIGYDLKKIFSTLKFIKPEMKDLNLTDKELLIDIMGYVYFSCTSKFIDIIVPEQFINDRIVSPKQISTVSELLKINNEPQFLLYKMSLTSGKYDVQLPKVKTLTLNKKRDNIVTVNAMTGLES